MEIIARRTNMKEKQREQAVLIVGTLLLIMIGVGVFFFSSESIIPIAPTGLTTGNDALFRWNSLGDYERYELIVDNNPEFTSPLIVKTTLHEFQLNLPIGRYYWKVRGYGGNVTESQVESFYIESVVAVEKAGREIRNSGNAALFLKLLAGNLFTGNVILDTKKSITIENNISEVEASQLENEK